MPGQVDGSSAEVNVVEASKSNVPSLSTIVARSFHPVNPYIKKVLPDTGHLRAWWSTIFTDEINDNKTRLLSAIDPKNDTAIAVLSMRRMAADDKGAGTWNMYELTPDHDVEGYKAMIDSMGEHRERLMLGRPHFLIQLFGVDNTYAGRGIGQRLLARSCEIGDADGLDIFVQANASARTFYWKQGFEVGGEEVMPGETHYVEYMLVRPCKT
ncbi:hypothetical protein B0A55_06617 [Friedmanniomyces simplex]|uniref:N-acetyltransferase domain-containing protein n=1 Tax=Friedmanniomyces simplex TaxID=329884 RepID=A0A4V6WL32_9PEZI|nr:hypothetical protein B0A55_06617 [Friedmanniomyces simplex]